jgi:hypothetical protein
MLDWFNVLHANPEHEEIEFIYVDKDDGGDVPLAWLPEEVEVEDGQ